jgi:glucose 1-dehydrogenase
MSARFEGRSVIVTGGGGGMGRATSLAFAAEGAKVLVVDVAADNAMETVDLIRAAGGTGETQVTDVSDAGQVQAMVAAAVERFGGLDHAVNMAAIENEETGLHECEDDRFDRMIAVNLRSVFLCMKHEITAMLAAGKPGTIVNIGSTNSFRPQPHQPAYTASKFGVLGITKQAAIDYAPKGIRINMIAPGPIDTPMLRNAMARRGRDIEDTQRRLSLIGRFGRPEEIAKAALFLSSDESTFTIGDTLAVDGGYLAR